MTKAETTALLEAVKNAPIVDGKITVTVMGTTFSFGGKTHFHDLSITENNRQQWLDNIAACCRMRFASSHTKKVLDEPGLKHQNRIVEKMLYERAKPQKKNKGKFARSEYFFFVLDGMEYVQKDSFDEALAFAKSIGKRRSDVWKIEV